MALTVLEEGVRLRKRGFAIHWLRSESKIPIEAGWSDAPVKTEEQLRDTYRTGYNLGFRAGKWSIIDGAEVCVLDIDVRGGERFAEEARAAARGLLGESYSPTVATGSGPGLHQYLRFPPGTSPNKASTLLRQSDVWVCDGKICPLGTPGGKPAWLIELLSTGKNVVLPPSIHPDTHRPYAWL
jgi:hypothetical protein